jgi:aryl-alcohol dehydrogenase-like predicted oxidoreductase
MGLDRIISNQPQYSALWRVIEPDIIPTSRELGVSQIVWSPIAQGVLTGKYAPGAEPPPGSRSTSAEGAGFIRRLLRTDVLEAVAKLRPVAEDAGLTMAQLAVAWVLRNDNVASAIIGASRPEQVRENVAASGVTLDEEIVARMDDILSPVAVLTQPAVG